MVTKKQTKPKAKQHSKLTSGNLAMAADPNTSPAQLEKLARSTNLAVKRKVAANPNTPARVLLRLSNHCFNDFAQNPVLPLLLLDDPTILNGIPLHAATRLANLSDLPEHLLKALASSPEEEIRVRIALHPNLTRECFETLLFDDSREVRQKALKNINVPDDLVALIDSFGLSEYGHREREPDDVPEEVLRQLAEKGLGGKVLAAIHPKTPADVLEGLYEYGESLLKQDWQSRKLGDDLCSYVVRNPNTPIPILQRAIQNKGYDMEDEAKDSLLSRRSSQGKP